MRKYEQYMILIRDVETRGVVQAKFWLNERKAREYMNDLKFRWNSPKFRTIRKKLRGEVFISLYGLKIDWIELEYCYSMLTTPKKLKGD